MSSDQFKSAPFAFIHQLYSQPLMNTAKVNRSIDVNYNLKLHNQASTIALNSLKQIKLIMRLGGAVNLNGASQLNMQENLLQLQSPDVYRLVMKL